MLILRKIKTPKPTTKIWRPTTKQDVKQEILAHKLLRPEYLVVLIAWVDLPGDNTQRSQHWSKAVTWKTQLAKDFQTCMNLQDHPGELINPKIFIEGYVAAKCDKFNQGSRYKKVLDLLQPLKLDKKGRKTGGVGLINNDRDVMPDVEEFVLRPKTDLNGVKEVVKRRVVVYAGCYED